MKPTANSLSLRVSTFQIRFDLIRVHWAYRAKPPRGIGFRCVQGAFHFPGLGHSLSNNQTLLTAVMVLLILGVVLSSGGLWKDVLFHRKEWFSGCDKPELSPSQRTRRVQMGRKSCWRLSLGLKKHLFKVLYLERHESWLTWHFPATPILMGLPFSTTPLSTERLWDPSMLGAPPKNSALQQPGLWWDCAQECDRSESQYIAHENQNSTLSPAPCCHAISPLHGNSDKTVTVFLDF